MNHPPKRIIVATYALALSVSLTQEEEDALQAEFKRAKSTGIEASARDYVEFVALIALRKEIERMVKTHKKQKEKERQTA